MPLRFATLVLEKTYTFQGADPKAPNRLLVGMEAKVTIEPSEGANVTATIRKQEGRGTMIFDAEAGHVTSARLTQKLDMTISSNGQNVEDIRDTTTSLTLVP